MARDKILVVDDVAINRNILVKMLQNDYDIIQNNVFFNKRIAEISAIPNNKSS
jgi:CheY-like chemotaxis protein